MPNILTRINLPLLGSLLFLLGSGSPPPYFENGMKEYKGGNYALAFEIWHPLGISGNVEAQFYLGTMYDLGEGVTKNLSKASEWYRKAAKQKHITAQYNLAWMYRFGKGVEKNHKKALNLFTLAANKGLAIAQFSLGSMYRFGEGATKNLILAHSWTNIASMQGNHAATRNREAIESEMTSIEIQEAKRLASKCKLKDFVGCVNLLTY